MKISVEIYTLAQRFGDERAIELIKEAGFDAVDLSYYYARDIEEITGDGYLRHVEKMRAYLDKYGLVANQAHAPFKFKYGMQMDESEPDYRSIVRSIASAGMIGAKNIIVHSIIVPEGVSIEDYNVEYYSSLIPYCEKYGICVAIENLFAPAAEPNTYTGRFGSPEDLNRVVERINSPYIVACVDVGHASLTGYKPEEFIAGMNPDILAALHIQDTDYLSDRHMLPYTQTFDWTAIMTALKEKGYRGDLTLEIIKYLGKFPDELLPDALLLAGKVANHLRAIFENA
jgi:sugar phosphate isomerase/epimerase